MSSRCCFMFLVFNILSTILFAYSASFSSNEQDRMTLLALKDEFLKGGTPLADGAALNSWNISNHFCQWEGIKCGKRHRRVTGVNLNEQKLHGILSPSIGNLTFLKELYLVNNSLHGQVPKEIGHLWRLRYLHLRRNSFKGLIPEELGNCSNLIELNLSENNFTGNIPHQLGYLLKLSVLGLYNNNLMGKMPSFMSNISSLARFDVAFNYFYGGLGDSLQGLSKLIYLSMASNSFSGTLSPLYNLSSLQILEISMNQFTGTLGKDIDVAFPKLTVLSMFNNSVSGTIPYSLSNISELSVIQLDRNNFIGSVPNNLGNMKNLVSLILNTNILGSNKSDDLSFIDSLTNCTKFRRLIIGENRFGGKLPKSLANLSSDLHLLEMRENYIGGSIPEEIARLSGLTRLSLATNLFSGSIPKSIGKLSKLSKLYLDGNNFSGEIPSSIGNLTELYDLTMQTNSLSGSIPISLGNCNGMQFMDISSNLLNGTFPNVILPGFQKLVYIFMSRNAFQGTFPSAFGTLRTFNALDASYNNFSGGLPDQLGESLEFLYLAGNSFNGSIPPSFGKLRSLRVLDLSDNKLSGGIPKEIVSIVGLRKLNLSFNQLEGEVPIFKNVIDISLEGNGILCGGNPYLHLSRCFYQRNGKRISRKIIIATTVVATSSVLLLVLVIFCYRKTVNKHNAESLEEGFLRVTYSELYKATEGFAEANLIGAGSFGNVYKGILNGEESKPVAVKVLNLLKHGAATSFKAECKVLRSIRHRNLLRIITSCSSLDHKGNDFKALVFDLMSNGNLDNWLHFSDGQRQEERAPLNLAKRLEIAIDVGCALDYLHNQCETPIIHCDLKPSNILLDDDLVAHVADFGLAKLLHGITEDFSRGESLSAVIKGSIGYIAPEYGLNAAVSTQGDIYSYGIVLLELITGKKPTDDMFSNEMSLTSFVKRAIPDRVEEIVDDSLVNELQEAAATQRNPEQFTHQWRTFLVSFAEVGISCSEESPKDRMDIQSAIKCLMKIKEKCDLDF